MPPHKQLAFVLLMLSLTSCGHKPSPNVAALTGIWQMQGYGKIIAIRDSAVNLYDITKNTCVPVKTILIKDLEVLGTVIFMNKSRMIVRSGITNYVLDRIPALPGRCSSYDSRIASDPVYNFEVFWNTFNEHYAYFKERKVDWDKIYYEVRPRVTHSTKDETLYQLLAGIADRFDDGHISLNVPEAIIDEAGETDPDAPASSEMAQPKISAMDFREAILRKYVKKYKSRSRDMEGNGLINWGITKENVGYLQVNWMIFYTDYGIPDSVKGDEFSGLYIKNSYDDPKADQHEVGQVNKIMKEVITDFKNVKSVIIDIRMNEGGYDAVALEILSHFTPEKTLAFIKKARSGSGYTPTQKIFLTPSAAVYTGPVFLLTSGNTASAAEIFTLSSMALKKVTRIGSVTGGIFSDVLEKKLPNGWTFSLSNEVYQSPSGVNFESRGIEPHITLKYPEHDLYDYLMKNLKTGDKGIETALKF